MRAAPLLLAVSLAGDFLCRSLSSATSAPVVTDLPHLPPVEATNALATFTLRPGFRIELVAAEPLVRDPIEACFDADGRLYVVEMIDYSERRNEQPHLGRIRRLEDDDGDGRFDRSVIFVDDLPWPTGVACWRDGVFVAATPDLFFCRDTDGDGRAESREMVYTGFGRAFAPYEVTRLNMQAMVNSLRWGLDNRFHGLTGPNGGELTSPFWSNAAPVSLRGRDFALDPRTFRLEVEAGGGQYGMSFDDQGRRFTCNNSDHVRVFMYELRYANRNPDFAPPPALQSIAADGPAAPVFRTSPEEPWRVLRTQWRVAGLVPGPVEGGGRASGYFTSATGLTIYRGDAWPEDYVGDAFIADCGSNLVHRKRLRPEGVALVAERPADEQRTEFLACVDTWFRPVQFANAPDGTLYVLDMYREIIEHPWSLPPAIKQQLDLNSGNDRGRIYRIVPEDYRQRPPPKLSRASTAELVPLLAHRNAWHRETAARLLYERQDATAQPALEALLEQATFPLARLHALYALAGLRALEGPHVLRSLRDTNDVVRQHAIRLSDAFLATDQGRRLLAETLLALTGDPSPHVRYQLAFTLGELSHPDRVAGLEAIARRDASDPWVRAAVLTSLAEGLLEMFDRVKQWFAADSQDAAPGEYDFLRELVRVIGARNRGSEVRAVLDFVNRSQPAVAFALVHALGEGLEQARGSLDSAQVKPVLERAATLAKDPIAPETTRVEAVQLLALTTFAESGAGLLGLLDQTQPQTVQLAALRALSRFPDPAVGQVVADCWPGLTPRLRQAALSVLLARPDRIQELFRQVEAGHVRRADLDSTQLDFLMNHRDAEIRHRAIALLAGATNGDREQVVEALLPAAQLAGDPARGKATFLERCASCHRWGDDGFALGPDLASVRNAGREKLLVNIVDPSREVLPQYLAFEIETKDQESLLGILVSETAHNLTLRQAYGRDTVLPRAAILSMRSRGKSVMPDNLEAGLTPQQIADLLEFISAAP